MKTTYKLLALAVIIIACMTEAMADIQITIYGKGGMVNGPGGTVILCPETSSDKCATITLPDNILNPDGGIITGMLTYNGKTQEVEVVDMPNLAKGPDGYTCQSIIIKGLDP